MAEGHGSWDSIHTKYLERADAEREDAGWPHPTLQGLEAEDGDENVSDLHRGDGCRTLAMYQMPLSCTPHNGQCYVTDFYLS